MTKAFNCNILVTRPVYLCSYKDYRSNEDYSLTPQFWLISAVRFAFVILFEVSQESSVSLYVEDPATQPSLSRASRNRHHIGIRE